MIDEIFPTCEKISIEYTIMEMADYIYNFPADLRWSDVGTYGSLRTLLPHDESDNVVVGQNDHLNGCKGCFVHPPNVKSIVLEGLN